MNAKVVQHLISAVVILGSLAALLWLFQNAPWWFLVPGGLAVLWVIFSLFPGGEPPAEKPRPDGEDGPPRRNPDDRPQLWRPYE